MTGGIRARPCWERGRARIDLGPRRDPPATADGFHIDHDEPVRRDERRRETIGTDDAHRRPGVADQRARCRRATQRPGRYSGKVYARRDLLHQVFERTAPVAASITSAAPAASLYVRDRDRRGRTPSTLIASTTFGRRDAAVVSAQAKGLLTAARTIFASVVGHPRGARSQRRRGCRSERCEMSESARHRDSQKIF